MKKIIPKILTAVFLLLIIIQTISFLYFNLFNEPVLADNSTPYLQVDIPTVNFLPASTCSDDNTKLCVNWIGEYIAGIYKYAVGIVGIVAAVVLMFGGVLYLTAGGSGDKISNAKSWIGASLTGLVLVLSSYLLLSLVNPDLVNFKTLSIKKIDTAMSSEYYEIASTKNKSTFDCSEYCSSKDCKFSDAADEDGYYTVYCKKGVSSKACAEYKTTKNTINFSSATLGSLNISSNCNNYNFTGYGVNAKILKSIAMAESSCTASVTSGAGACGLMQLLPNTASKTCGWLNSNPQKSIEKAAQYIISNVSKHGNERKKIFAGYNSGYSTTVDPNTGKKGALADSSDCPGNLAYECCINPGELTETQDYIVKAEKYYNGF